MTPNQISDYIINNDLEVQAAQNDFDAIARAIRVEFGPDVTDSQIEAGIRLARQDEYIRMVGRRLGVEFYETLAPIHPTFVQCALYGCEVALPADDMIWDEYGDNAYHSLEHKAEAEQTHSEVEPYDLYVEENL